jgi:N-acetylneuraminic acid mutarotase
MTRSHSMPLAMMSALCAIAACATFIGCSATNSTVARPAAQESQAVQRLAMHPTTSNTWTAGANMPKSRCCEGVAAVGDDIYVVGGYGSAGVLNNNQEYDTLTNTWTNRAPMPTARWALTAAAVNGIVYAIGGDLGNGQYQDIVEAYDPSTNMWSTKTPMPTVRNSLTSTVLNNVIYVIGGYNGTRLSTVEAYDPATDTWTTDASLPLGVSYASVGTVNTAMVASGGYDNSGNTVRNTESWNGTAHAWQTRALAPSGRQAACAAGIGGSLYIAGGDQLPAERILNSVFDYTLSSNAWGTLATMPHGVVGAGGAAVNGVLYCMGGGNTGFEGAGRYFNYVQIYTP